MNTKIEEYIESELCRKHDEYDTNDVWYEFSQKELDGLISVIIKECIDIFQPPKIDDPKWSFDEMARLVDIQEKIEQHFGIE